MSHRRIENVRHTPKCVPRRYIAIALLVLLVVPAMLHGSQFAVVFNPTTFDFAEVAIGNFSDETVSLSIFHGGSAQCAVGTIQVDGDAEYSIASETCPATATVPTACDVTIRYTPSATESNSAAVILSGSTCSGGNVATVTLSGTGVANAAPSLPTLVYPKDGATGMPTSLTLIWEESEDGEGDAFTYMLFICENEDFDGCDGTEVSALWGSGNLLAGGAAGGLGLLVLGLLLPMRRKQGGSLVLLLAGITVAVMIAVACSSSGGGGGSSSSNSDEPGDGEVGHEVTGLESNTTYYWKVRVEDDNGNAAETDVFSFTTE